MTPEQKAFGEEFLPVCRAAVDLARADGLKAPKGAEYVLLSQAAVETGWGGAKWMGRNLTGISPAGRLAEYGTYAAWAAAQVSLMLGPYRSAWEAPTLEEVCVRLGQSPWATTHYEEGGRVGGSLLDVLAELLSGLEEPGAGLELRPGETLRVESGPQGALEVSPGV